MTVAQLRNDEMVALLRADLLPASDRNVCLSLADMGGNSFTAEETHPLSDVRFNGAPTLYGYNAGSGEITVNEPGIYWIQFAGTIQNSTGAAAAEAGMWLQADAGSGFATVVGASFSVYLPAAANWRASGSRSVILRLGAGHRLRLRVARTHGTDTLAVIAQGSTLEIVRLIGLGSA